MQIHLTDEQAAILAGSLRVMSGRMSRIVASPKTEQDRREWAAERVAVMHHVLAQLPGEHREAAR